MALFDFKLKDIQEITPWGESPNLYLHWFALTDSFYHLNIKGKELFRYSNEILDYWNKQNPDEKQSKYVDYNIARLYEDFLEILPAIMQPIPEEIYEYIKSNDTHQAFIDNINKVFECELDDEDGLWDLHNDASLWLSCRRLDTGHLTEGPFIWFLRFKNDIIVRWNNEDKLIDGIQPWFEVKGEKKYTYQEFMSEVKIFHNRLISQMQSRVDMILQGNLLTHINIDKNRLIEENEQKKDSFLNAQRNQPSIDNWDSVIYAINKLLK